jgi:lysophospholipase L1-like esterase
MSASVERSSRSRVLALVLGIVLGAMIVGTFLLTRRSRKPVGFVRTTSDATKLLTQHAGAPPDRSGSEEELRKHHLPRVPIDYSVARMIFPIDGEVQEFDPQVYFRHVPNIDFPIEWKEHKNGAWIMHTNSLALREDAEPMIEKPDLRIIVAGDSHTEGVCNNFESFPHVLGRALSIAHPGKKIESINAAKGGYSFYNYLGTLEKFLYLKPDVFIVSVYGGNDFEEVLTPYHYFSGTTRLPGSSEYWPQVQKALSVCGTWLAQDGMSLKYFQEQPAEIRVALQAAREATLDIQDTCKENGIALYYVYIPSRFDGEDPQVLAQNPNLAKELYAAMEIRPDSVSVHDAMGNALIKFLDEHGIPVVDMRKVFPKNKGPFYWAEDHHISANAHRVIGESLVPVIESGAFAGLR